MAKVKICGLRRPADIEAANEAKPDYIGFVFAESRRKVTLGQALALRERLLSDIVPVGVFADEDIGFILSAVNHSAIEVIQLHGEEDEAYIHALKMLTDKPVIKAVAIRRNGDAQAWLGSEADYLLLDNRGGGTGRNFDWRLIGVVEKLFFLAGGLDPENINTALDIVRTSGSRMRESGGIGIVQPYAVDVSSGVETGGYKDPVKIRDFIEKVRTYGA